MVQIPVEPTITQTSRKRAGSSDLLQPTLSDLGQPDEKRSKPSPPPEMAATEQITSSEAVVVVAEEPSSPRQSPLLLLPELSKNCSRLWCWRRSQWLSVKRRIPSWRTHSARA
jgi:hypothetical protein